MKANIADAPDANLCLTVGKPPAGSRCFTCSEPVTDMPAGALTWCKAEVGITGFNNTADLQAAIEDAAPGDVLMVFTVCLSCLGRAAAELVQWNLDDGAAKGRRLRIERNIQVVGWE